ncbi:EAL domain-containing protein [Vibrio sp. CAU 1672]|uniref:EAL domain-containing protein n=1 Tax=Vibrio sp. CAU 1672 TaxID=3032594 RepID=UPI0023DCDF61|nr:EAL domain-containing protein [Vibrio sp. CAU 1672]MDF2153519.1 EAL domain-containing protein [Vibrio sp. CAU 1672]
MSSFRRLNASLRHKTALYFSLGLVGMIVSFLFITRYFFLYSLDELERMDITKASRQAQSAISMMVARQLEHSYDWAHWDETYHLLDKPEQEIAGYRERNLYEGALDVLSLDMLAFVTRDGSLVDQLSRTPSAAQSADLITQILAHPAIRRHIASMEIAADFNLKSKSGLFKIDQQIWSISLTPVRNSEGTSISSGWLIWGQDLTLRFPGDFKTILTSESQLLLALPAELEKQQQILSKQGSLLERDNKTMTQWTPILDNDLEPIAFLKTVAPRAYYVKGHKLFICLFGAVGLAAGVIGLCTFFLFSTRVGTRFAHFEQGISQLLSQHQIEHPEEKKIDELELATKLVKKLSDNTSVTQTQLKDSLEKFNAIYHSGSVGMLLVLNREIIDCNEKTLELLSYQSEQLLGYPLDKLCPPSSKDALLIEQIFNQLKDTTTKLEAPLVNSLGEEIACLLEISQIQHNGQNALLMLIHDLRETKQQAQLIQQLSYLDPVSGLRNRPSILNALQERSANEPNQFSFLYISVKGLKQIAEVYGHLIFDEAVKFTGKMFAKHLSAYQVGRISEFEFIAIIPSEQDFYQAMSATHKLMDKLSQKVEVSDLMIDLHCKAVIADKRITHKPLDLLLQTAIYTVQTTETRYSNEVVVIDEKLTEKAQTALLINRDIEYAIHNDQIIAYYQPIVNTQSGKIVGFEALARWNHPSLGLISPDVFIPLAEQSKLIVELGESILKQACSFVSQLNQQRAKHGLKPLSIHVNISAQHFYHARLTEHLHFVLAEYSIAPGILALEITESMLMGVETETIQRMNEVKELGVQLALDDFGTGYASFGSLCAFPLDVVKLDKSYIDQIETNDRAKTLVRNIAKMAQELGLSIVAEGVETASQVRKLKVWDIDELQGYYFYKPMPEAETHALFCGEKVH